MFTPEDILARMRGQPFLPLRIVTTTGHYDVYHPDLVLVGRRYLEVGTASSDNPETFDTISRVAILHITELQDLPASASPTNQSGNGR